MGTVPSKYQFALVLDKLEFGVDFNGVIGAVWTRGPHKVKTVTTEGKNGLCIWDKAKQTEYPAMLVSTLYMEKDKKKDKGKENDGPNFNSKTSRLTIKQISDDTTKTIGEITIDLAKYALSKAGQWDIELPLEKCTDKNARLFFTLHSRPSNATGGAEYDTLSTMDGMDQSFVDNDSIVDFSAMD